MRWVLAVLILLLSATPAAAADDDIGLLRGLGVMTRDGWPSASVTLADGSALFAADDGVHGRELWRTDGTAGGTQIVDDLVPGPAGSGPAGLTVIGGVAYFGAGDAGGGREVWRTDGTAAGTRKLADISSPAAQAKSAAANLPGGPFYPLGNEVAFLYPHVDGYYLAAISSKGGGGGARVLDVLGPGEYNDLTLLGSTGDALFFRRGGSLYRTDGTRAGTLKITVDHGITSLVTVGRHAVISGWSFEREGELSVLAPGAARATVLAPGGTVNQPIDGRVYFTNRQGLHSWAPGEPVRDIEGPLPIESTFGPELAPADGALYWSVSGAYGAAQLYRAGTGIIGVHALNPVGLTPIGGGRMLFHAWDDRLVSTQHALWITDGTEAGTRRLTEPTGIGLLAIGLTRNGAIFPDYTSQGDIELFHSDGTPEGTGLLADINRVPVGSGPVQAARVGGRVVFRTVEFGALWTTDGTADGTRRLPLGGFPYGIASDGTTAYLGGSDGAVYRTDGTPAGTAKILDAGIGASTFQGLGRIGSAFVFSAESPFPDDAGDLWRTDGTAAGTRRIHPGLGWGRLVAAGERRLLIAGGYKLVSTDGETATTVLSGGSDYHQAVAFKDGFLAGAYTEETGLELFRLDADGGNPRLVADLGEGASSSNPRAFARVGDRVLFAAGQYATEWYVTDGETVRRFDGFNGGWANRPSVTVGGVTYVVTQSGYDALLYRTDATEAGTVLLHRFPFGYGEPPESFAAFNGTTWFAASDPEHGRELWRTDGTPEGTRLARDIRPGRASSDPLDLVATDDFLFFTAFDDVNGAEPWRIRRAAPPTDPPAEEPPPVTIAPIAPTPVPPATPQVRPPPAPTIAAKATVTIRVQRLRKLRGRTRWRVSGITTAGACAGPVKIVLGRRDRALKTTKAKLTGCRFRVIVSTTSRAGGRWLQVRSGGATSRRVTAR